VKVGHIEIRNFRGIKSLSWNVGSAFACQTIANTVQTEARGAGVALAELSPKVDIQRQSVGSGALSLHEDNVPLRNKGSGSKRLIGTAMQIKLHGGKNVSLIDEIEMGLEPHRIRGLIYKLRNSPQQVFATTHSPVVIRELDVAAHELYVCKRDAAGAITVQSLGTVPDIQGPVRSNAEAFLGSRIVACEGATEIGCLRAYDLFRLDAKDPPVWSLSTSYFNCGGASSIAPTCPQLVKLGYMDARPPGPLEYCINQQVFYLKFVPRDALAGHSAITMPIDQYEILRTDPESKGPKGAFRVSYRSLNGRYLRQEPFLELIRAGYIGAHADKTADLKTLVDAVLKDDRAVVAAIHSYIPYGSEV
jgi:hypothetical protein